MIKSNTYSRQPSAISCQQSQIQAEIEDSTKLKLIAEG